MNDEIREILDKWKDKDGTIKVNLTLDGIRQLNDYITNLQQKYDEADYDRHKLFEENERLKQLIDADNESYDIQETIINRQKSELLELDDYKSRCEKAIEYIKDNPTDTWYDAIQQSEKFGDIKIIRHQEILLNILQNGSEENE